MTKVVTILVLLLGISTYSDGQVVIPLMKVPEHGFLPGKKFQFYSTIDKYNLSSLSVKIELYDDRNELNLQKVNCSEIMFTNTSEFAQSGYLSLIGQYMDTLLLAAGGVVDATSSDVVQIHLEGIDARMIKVGLAEFRAHGLCQLRIKYKGHEKTYCTDITDKDKHSPVSSRTWMTRKTSTRIIASAAIRETIEQFFRDIEP